MKDEHTRFALTRRRLLQGGAAAAAVAASGTLLPPTRALGAGSARKLVVIVNSGGWDTTYALDPKPGLATVDAPDGDVQMFGGLPIYTDPSRPAVSEFFTRYADRVALINGLQVRSFVHPDCLKRILTGSPSETTADMAAVTAFEHAADLPVPYLALGGQARSGPLAAITGRTGTTHQLAALVDPAQAYGGDGLIPDRGVDPSVEEAALVRDYLEASAERLRATRGQRGYNQRRVQDFISSLTRAQQLVGFSEENDLGERNYTLDLDFQIPLAVRALKDGLSHSVLLQTDNWDTHQNNAQQSMLHESLFGSLSTLVQAFDDAGTFDDTLFVVLSEMGRTPRLNSDGGKDHWPVTSAMIFGGGVRGGSVFGASSDELDALSVDLSTGEADAGGKQLAAANFVAGIYSALGVDPEPHLPGVQPFDAFCA